MACVDKTVEHIRVPMLQNGHRLTIDDHVKVIEDWFDVYSTSSPLWKLCEEQGEVKFFLFFLLSSENFWMWCFLKSWEALRDFWVFFSDSILYKRLHSRIDENFNLYRNRAQKAVRIPIHKFWCHWVVQGIEKFFKDFSRTLWKNVPKDQWEC